MAVSGALLLITRTTSLSGNHSLIEHRASVEEAAAMAPECLLRLSVGLELVDDRIDDLGQALRALNDNAPGANQPRSSWSGPRSD